MPNYITHGLVHKKGLGKQRVGKQTSGQNIKGEAKQKRRLLRFSGYYQYSNEIAVMKLLWIC